MRNGGQMMREELNKKTQFSVNRFDYDIWEKKKEQPTTGRYEKTLYKAELADNGTSEKKKSRYSTGRYDSANDGMSEKKEKSYFVSRYDGVNKVYEIVDNDIPEKKKESGRYGLYKTWVKSDQRLIRGKTYEGKISKDPQKKDFARFTSTKD